MNLSNTVLIVKYLYEYLSAYQRINVVLKAKLARGIHNLIENGSESAFLKPFWQKVLISKRKFIDVALKENVIDGYYRLSIRSHPLIRHYVNEKPTTFAS